MMLSWSERLYAGMLHAFPRAFRNEFRTELLQTFRDYRRENALGASRFWLLVVTDTMRSASREWLDVARRRGKQQHAHRPPYFDALLASMCVLAVYIATLAPTVAFWDSGEYLTAAHTLGIPHPPGNPLFVLVAHGWERLLSPLGLPVSVRINLLSALFSAAAHGFWYLVAYRLLSSITKDAWLRRLGAAAAVLLSATAFTVWNQSNVNEKVYTLSLFTVALVTWLALRWRDAGRKPGHLIAIAFVLFLTSTNHLMGVLAAPAVLAFVLMVDWRVLIRRGLWAGVLAAGVVGLTPQFFLPVRAAQRPILSEGEPTCESLVSAAATIYTWGREGCPALASELTREQYDKPSLKLDPTVYPDYEMPRGPHLIAHQFLNYFQYFNWQWGRSIDGYEPQAGGFLRPLLTLLFIMLGLMGARAHWQSDRAGAMLLSVLFTVLSFGLVVYLNFKYGYAMQLERFPAAEMHEVRERDYFFLISFSLWGLWAGPGLVLLWQRVQHVLRDRFRWHRLVAAPVLGLALIPLVANWRWASRADDYTARDWAYNVLMSVEPYGVLFTNGDNDTFPLWYLQEVEGVRRDVTVMVTSYLNTSWYARQVRDLTRPCPAGVNAADDPTRIICQRSFDAAQLPSVITARSRVAEPDDSILPLSDAQIEQIAARPFITRDSMTLLAGRISATIEAGTTMFPADTFVAAIVQASIGKRPIHFMGATPALSKLGLFDYTIRRGLTFQINNGPVTPSAEVVSLPRTEVSGIMGAFVDLPATAVRLNDVFLRRGRITDPTAPWADAATTNILAQYAWAHFAVAQAYAMRGDSSVADWHVKQAGWWQRFAD
jgi:hypothetical protein